MTREIPICPDCDAYAVYFTTSTGLLFLGCPDCSWSRSAKRPAKLILVEPQEQQ